MQIGGEVNYFATRQITATAGLEYWSTEGVSFLVGGRWYPNENTFVRLRGLVGANDLSVGAGWSKPINENFRFEAIGDFYFKLGKFASRAAMTTERATSVPMISMVQPRQRPGCPAINIASE